MRDSVWVQWEDNAEAFADLIAEQGTPHNRKILNPWVEKLLGDVKGKYLLDAGCGEGYLSRRYAQLGAKVLGIDFSNRLIELAMSKTTDEQNVEYMVGNICRLEGIPDSAFDSVLCNLVLLNVACLEDAINEFYRVLKPGGVLVCSIVHPAFNFYGPGTWEMGEKNPVTNRRIGLYFKVDNYLDEKSYERYWKTKEGEKFPRPITFFHRKVSTYVNALVSAGFTIDVIDEPIPPPGDDFFERERRIPFFMVFKAMKKNNED